MRKVRSEIEGERFIHKELWRVVERQLEHSKRTPTGAFYDDLVAMVFAFHAFEAHLNYVGGILAPEVWKDERNYFRSEPYRGFDGKVRKVLQLAGVAEPDRAVRPYSTVWLLKDLRDLMAHGKVEKFAAVIEHAAGTEANRMPSTLDPMVTAENAQLAHDDILAMSQLIHDAAHPKVEDVWFGRHAYKGAIQHGQGSTRIAT